MHAAIPAPIFAPRDAKGSGHRLDNSGVSGRQTLQGRRRAWPNECRGLLACLDSFSERSLYRRLVWPGPVHDAQQGGGVAQLVRAAES
jgi:hypothetical protein